MATISEADFARLCEGIAADRDTIVRHNPIGGEDETLLWMLLGCLASYLSLGETEMPCFPGRADADVYRDAILHVLGERREGDFDPRPAIDKMLGNDR